MFKAPAYVIISWVFLILIGIVFCYSYFFYPNSHPINCLVKQYTGKDCATCGFSRAFSFYSHFQFTNGKTFNSLSWPVFLFFLFQFFLRLFVVLHYYLIKKILTPAYIKADVLISISGFLLAFLPILFKN
jgi:hypothetical protein